MSSSARPSITSRTMLETRDNGWLVTHAQSYINSYFHVNMDKDVDPATALHPENMAHNARSLNYVRSTMSIVSGALCGIIGFTSYRGFLFYLVTSTITGLVVNLWNASLRPAKYFQSGFRETLTQNLAGNLMAYTLFWTLFYGLVHVYEA